MNYVYTRNGETFVNVDDVTMLGEDIEFTKEDLLCMLHDIEQYDKTGDVLSHEEVTEAMYSNTNL